MTLNHEQRCRRVRERAEELLAWQDRERLELDRWTFDDAPLAIGHPWPRRNGSIPIQHPEVGVPPAWPLEDARLDLDLGGEGLVRLRYDDGSVAAFGLDPNHRIFPITHRRFGVAAECVARLPFGVPNREARIGHARLVWREPA
ncbi:MAG: alpha-mannosidase, partial [Alphaproteobacteria bacterium]